MRGTVVLSLVMLFLAQGTLSAQTCRGLASFSTGPVQVSGQGSMTFESNAVGAGVAYGLTEGFFANGSIASRSIDTFSGSSLELGAGAGYEIAVGKFHVCPQASTVLGFGPNKPFGAGEDRSSRSAQIGVAGGILAGTIRQWQILPTFGLSYAYRKDQAQDDAGTMLFQISDHYALAQLGVGLVLRNLSIRPQLDLPLSFLNSNPSVGITVSYNFGRRILSPKQPVP
jgi:hypothetical protein